MLSVSEFKGLGFEVSEFLDVGFFWCPKPYPQIVLEHLLMLSWECVAQGFV